VIETDKITPSGSYITLSHRVGIVLDLPAPEDILHQEAANTQAFSGVMLILSSY
jgi:hypothetical protein